jgi:hypothetical protein
MDLPDGKRHTLGDTISILGIALSLLLWAVCPTLYARAGALTLVVALSIYLAHRSHFTRAWSNRKKLWAASIAACSIVALSCAQLVPQWKSEHHPELKGDTRVAVSKQESPAPPLKVSAAPSTPVKRRTPVHHAGHIHGDNNTTVGKTQYDSIEGSGNTIVGATDSAGNTDLTRGGTTIGNGACGCPTCVVIGAHAGCGSGSSDTLPKQP